MYQFSDIKSHPDLPLEEHLTQVAKIANDLLESKNVNFQSLGLTRDHLKALVTRASLFHDLGKATTYFQERLNTGKKGPNGEHQHTGLSTILAYKPLVTYCKENNLSESIALAPLLAVLYHHSKLSKALPNDSVMEDRLKAFKKEFLKLQGLKDAGLFDDIDLQKLNPVEIDCGMENLFADISGFSDEQKFEFRMLTLFIYSLLLEADKAYLAVKDKKLYQREPVTIDSNIVDKYKPKIIKNKKADINAYRERAYKEVIAELDNIDLNNHLYSLTLPTGMGKTLLAASWAIKLRNKIQRGIGFTPQIIIALPFLSIIDQTAKEYETFLDTPNEEVFLKTHSLSSFEFNGYEANTAEFFVNIWKSQIIMTTFDQLLYAFFSFEPKHLMRFHNLLNSIIIMDEVQALPPHLWHPFSTFIKYITEIGNSYLLLMSATQPQIIDNAIELVPIINNNKKRSERYFEKLKRYKLLLKHNEIKKIDDFIEEMVNSLPKMHEDKIMIVLDTRDSARKVYKELKKVADDRDIYFLSSYVIPAERLSRIEKIKISKRALVITTQCIEAGVDIDMDYVIRDFGPLDSIIQVAGRCNREGEEATQTVEIVRLYDPDAKSRFCPSGEFNAMVYDTIAIDATIDILKNSQKNEILENEIFELAKKYFIELRRKDLGRNKTECLLDFSHKYIKNGKQRDFDIKAELRGNLKQYNLIVERYVPELKSEIEVIFEENIDRWDRRRKLKELSSKISMNSISVNAYKFNPEEIATKGKGEFYFLDSGYYDNEVGFNYETPRGTIII